MINYMVDSENVGTKWIPYLKENIKKSDRVFLFYTDKSPSIPCNEIEELAAFINQIQTIYCHNKTANALDFQLCSYLGYLIRVGSKSSYCILTNDKGFDAAVSFWKDKGIKIYRSEPLKKEALTPISIKRKNIQLPHLGSLLSLKANSSILKILEDMIKKSSSPEEVHVKINSTWGKKTGSMYYKKLEKHLKRYYKKLNEVT